MAVIDTAFWMFEQGGARLEFQILHLGFEVAI
jgi:hypothetical protein